MPKPIDITPVKPNVWVALVEGESEGGTIIRRFERWTCTCTESDGECRHVLAARSLIAKAAKVVKAIAADASPTDDDNVVETHTSKTDIQPVVGAYDDADEDGSVFVTAPPVRKARPVVVSDRTAQRIAGKAVAA